MSDQDWQNALASQGDLRELMAPPPEERAAAGYGLTLAEICQQPDTWIETAQLAAGMAGAFRKTLEASRWVIFTGSGSSQYACECVHPAVQAATGLPAFTLGGGWLLVGGRASVPATRPGLVISLARSGDSPESCGVVKAFLDSEPEVRHWIVTCNAQGRLATQFNGDARLQKLVLAPRTNDRSLAMTSSFTNLVLASLALVIPLKADRFEHLACGLADAGRRILLNHTGTLATMARGGFRRTVYMGTGCRLGAARESALKMLEMTAGAVPTMAETYLGLRHGPMCLIDDRTLVVCFLSSGAPARAYEADLITELNRKELGARKLIVGENIPRQLLGRNDTPLEIPGMADLGDANVPVLDVMVGQLLAFFRCLSEGLHPDLPSSGVINRVVNEFKIYQSNS